MLGHSWWCVCFLTATGCEGLRSCTIVFIGCQLEIYATGCLISTKLTILLCCRQSTCNHWLTILVINWFADWTCITLAISTFAFCFLIIMSVKLHWLFGAVFYLDHLVVLVGLVLVHSCNSSWFLWSIEVSSVVQIVVASCPSWWTTTWIFQTVGWFAQVCNAFFFIRWLSREACYSLALAYVWQAALHGRSCVGHKNWLWRWLLINNHWSDGGKRGMRAWKWPWQVKVNGILRLFLDFFIQKLGMLVELCDAVKYFCWLLQWLLDAQNAQVFLVEPSVFLSLPPIDTTAKDLTFSVLRCRIRSILFVFGCNRATGNYFRRLNLSQL